MSLKQSYYCPFDDETKLIKIPKETDKLYTQFNDNNDTNNNNNNNKISNPSKIYKFVKSKTSEPSIHRNLKIYKNNNLFYKAKDIWEFDNIGVSKPPKDLKNPEFIKLKSENGGDIHNFAIVRYLVCGECDKGVFGFGGYSFDLEDSENRIEIGFDLSSVNPNDLTYFFYI
ncbi:hypothetical protein C6P40_002342 [Pichia californica]|uniref:Uncharacterized protein n=1 Tax=Pichia californica TaxID=460514 RepID=A0A9P6WNY9_9ASCO|nr:hypothetical protein C6P42_004905 [[Candida] californica]KAG0690591.1 hypothetical protein C6P40_002342 [[Candida] californica]